MTKIGKKLAAVFLAVTIAVIFTSLAEVKTAYADGDIEAPVPHPETITVEVIGKAGNAAAPGDTVRITMDISDETSVWDIMKFRKPISGGDGYETRKGRVEGTDTYWWEIDVDDSMEDGVWKIDRFLLEDNVGNEMWYFNSDIYTPDETQTDRVYADFSGADFVVVDTHPDLQGPVIDMESIQVSPLNAVPGDTVTMSLSATDASGVQQINLFIKRPNGTNITWQEMVLNSDTGKYEYKWKITNETMNGKWIVYSMRSYDNNGNMTEVGGESDEIAFFNVSGGIAETDPPEIDCGNIVLKYPSGQTAVSPGQKVSVGTSITDETGIQFVMFCYLLPQTGTTKLTSAGYSTETGRWDCDIDITDTAQTGIWKLLYIEAEDLLGNNIKVYNSDVSEESPSMNLSGADFIVKRNISKATITGVPTSVVYSGKEFTPEPILVDPTDGLNILLVKDVDYTVSYQKNVNVGEASVVIMGKGDYSGSVTEAFNITPKEITPAVTLSTDTYTWNGKVKKPTATVRDGSAKLAASDYKVTYKNNKNVGKASAVVTLKGNYSGSKTVTFKINPKGTSLSKVTKAKKAAAVKWKKQSTKMSASRITGYQIQIATNSKFTKNKKLVTVKGYSKTSRKVTSLKGGKKYYVRIRTYKKAGSTLYYSPWSKNKTVTAGK